MVDVERLPDIAYGRHPLSYLRLRYARLLWGRKAPWDARISGLVRYLSLPSVIPAGSGCHALNMVRSIYRVPTVTYAVIIHHYAIPFAILHLIYLSRRSLLAVFG